MIKKAKGLQKHAKDNSKDGKTKGTKGEFRKTISTKKHENTATAKVQGQIKTTVKSNALKVQVSNDQGSKQAKDVREDNINYHDYTGSSCKEHKDCPSDKYCDKEKSKRCQAKCHSKCLCGLYGVSQEEANLQCTSGFCNQKYFHCYRYNPSSPYPDVPYNDMVTKILQARMDGNVKKYKDGWILSNRNMPRPKAETKKPKNSFVPKEPHEKHHHP